MMCVYAHCQHLEDCPQFFAELHSFQHDLGVWNQSDHVTGWWVWPPDHERCPPHLQDNTGRKQHCQLVAWLHGESCQPPFPKEMIDTPPPTYTHTHHTPGVHLSRGAHDLLECLFPQCPHCRPSTPLSPPETHRQLVHKDNQLHTYTHLHAFPFKFHTHVPQHHPHRD